MSYYNNILSLFSLVMALAILFIVLFGCQYKRYRHYEGFQDIKTDEKKEPTPETPKTSPPSKTDLSHFENKLMEGLNDGTVSTKDLETMIKKEEFTQENLENMINYIEKFKGNNGLD
jgi:hypothetical protein